MTRRSRFADALADRAVRRLLKLPQPSRDYRVTFDVEVPMRDGVVLLADHYVPAGPVRGTILVRSPYGRAGVMGMLFCRPFALQGFQVLSVSCRATFGSAGILNAFHGEVEDGLDTVAWMREQSWFTGSFGTMGTSYLGLTQWALLTDPPPEMKTAVIVSGPHDTGRLLYGTGAINLVSSVGWTYGMVNQGSHGPVAGTLLGAIQRDKKYRHVLDAAPVGDAAHGLWGDKAAWFDEWLAQRDVTDPFWDSARVTSAHESTDIPVLLYSGWHDLILEQVLESYAALAARGVDVQLRVGPWSHADLVGKGAGQITRDALAWFAEHLAHDGERASTSPVRIKIGGSDEWRDLDAWPPASDTRTFYLQPGGGLAGDPPAADAGPSLLRYDPADPTPAVGGMSNALDAGRRDNTARERRADVLTFSTAPLTSALEVVGSPEVELAFATDNPHVDWLVRVCEVDTKGKSWNVSEVYARRNVKANTLRLTLSPMAHRFRVGTRIRLQISGGAHPVYDRNMGTGETVGLSSQMQVSNREIAHGKGGQSFVTLPVV